ncbi:alpha/beta hydrolase family protein [Pimelobacter simplex]|uniref:alpha/beta hydrolase family protein n=1 Tax=Nocardioides simplex TaxID=2045 RepID=UPI00214FC9EE|nr:alpha/beta hydrolase [Pimelobacter simplex]UUW89760.1 alpha/beta hydrolase [Pimelobacter simplex]UUW93589.1 alpha/beta hydrolase [Pimelobacter simplex]
MRTRIRAVVVAVMALASLGLTGCSGDEAPAPPREAAPSPSPSGTTSAPLATLPGALSRCGPQDPAVAAAHFRPRTLHSAAVGRVSAVTAGTGPTVAVLLHQTNGNGLCGWLPYAARLVARPGVQVLAIDLCGYGAARCTGAHRGARQTDAVSLAIDAARRSLGARTVVVVGASMGGSVALMTAVRDPRAARVADLSGPADWDGMEVVAGGRALRVPALVAMADDEGEDQVAASRAIAAVAPRGSRFEPAESGHGYALLVGPDGTPGPLAAVLEEWIRG